MLPLDLSRPCHCSPPFGLNIGWRMGGNFNIRFRDVKNDVIIFVKVTFSKVVEISSDVDSLGKSMQLTAGFARSLCGEQETMHRQSMNQVAAISSIAVLRRFSVVFCMDIVCCCCMMSVHIKRLSSRVESMSTCLTRIKANELIIILIKTCIYIYNHVNTHHTFANPNYHD